MNKNKLSWEEMMAIEPELIGINNEVVERIVERAIEEEREEILKIIDNLENPYPKDIFKWNNPEELNFNRGRFNQHCFDVWENFRVNLKRKLVER